MFRVLSIEPGKSQDKSGRQFGEDWTICDFGAENDGTAVFLTTDGATKETADRVLESRQEIASVLAFLLNEALPGMSASDWSDLVVRSKGAKPDKEQSRPKARRAGALSRRRGQNGRP